MFVFVERASLLHNLCDSLCDKNLIVRFIEAQGGKVDRKRLDNKSGNRPLDRHGGASGKETKNKNPPR